MDNRKTCKGCGNSVAKPITCNSCGIASHPGCITRSNHPNENGLFKDCSAVPSAANCMGLDKDLMCLIRDLIRSEFDSFRNEMCNKFGGELKKLKDDVQKLSTKMNAFEEKLSQTGTVNFEEELLSEIRERDRRASNIILFNLEEMDVIQSSVPSTSDLVLAQNIFQCFLPDKIQVRKTVRIGSKTQGRSRPLCVTLSSNDQVIDVLKNKYKYSGPVGISQDRTAKQRAHLKNLRSTLKSLTDAGVTDKTIRYFNGVPKIVKINSAQVSKNA